MLWCLACGSPHSELLSTRDLETYKEVAQTKTKQAGNPLREIVPNKNSYSCS
jgi:hypothetical protein